MDLSSRASLIKGDPLLENLDTPTGILTRDISANLSLTAKESGKKKMELLMASSRTDNS
jgi:hypothetical protein